MCVPVDAVETLQALYYAFGFLSAIAVALLLGMPTLPETEDTTQDNDNNDD